MLAGVAMLPPILAYPEIKIFEPVSMLPVALTVPAANMLPVTLGSSFKAKTIVSVLLLAVITMLLPGLKNTVLVKLFGVNAVPLALKVIKVFGLFKLNTKLLVPITIGSSVNSFHNVSA